MTYMEHYDTEQEIDKTVTRVGNCKVCVLTQVLLRMFIVQVVFQLQFLATKITEVAVPSLICITIRVHIATLGCFSVYFLYCRYD